MRVLGVDPGTVVMGWGIVDASTDLSRFVASGVCRPRGELPSRLAQLHSAVSAIVEQHRPAVLSLEKSYVGENVQTAFRLGEARGAILAAAAVSELEIVEYSPAEIKVSVVGHGRATKEQVQGMIGRLLGIATFGWPDEADALGAALCYVHTRSFSATLDAAGGGVAVQRRRGARVRRR